MRAFSSFLGKEFQESLRTYRLLIMVAAFVALGVLSPLLAKMVPDLLNGTDMGGGAILRVPPATALDSWGQFFKNISQLGVLILVIVDCGIMGTELAKGTLTNFLAKGLPRSTVIWAKFVSATVMWTLCYGLALLVTWGYTLYFWGNGPLSHAFLAFTCLWVFGVLLIALLILGGIIQSNIYGALLAAAAVIIVLNLVNIAPQAAKYNPISLAGGTVNLLSGHNTLGDYLPALWICLAAIVVIMAASLAVFDRKQL
ncbi:MAG: ABC transporter permease [Propionibacteriaceae bacterium]|nr:ABC transporter permease [Propionibacteriaceae bacterium]